MGVETQAIHFDYHPGRAQLVKVKCGHILDAALTAHDIL